MFILPSAWTLGCVFGFLGVALGAFGAHALKYVLSSTTPPNSRAKLSSDMQKNWETGVFYQFIHVFALLAVAVAKPGGAMARWPPLLFTVGILLFSGSLYTMALTGKKWLGAITPIGGSAFLAGWLLLAMETV